MLEPINLKIGRNGVMNKHREGIMDKKNKDRIHESLERILGELRDIMWDFSRQEEFSGLTTFEKKAKQLLGTGIMAIEECCQYLEE